MQLVSAVSRTGAGRDIGEVWGVAAIGVPVFGSVAEALADPEGGPDVVVDFTSHSAVKDNALAALEFGVSLVVGSSGLSPEDYDEIDALARARRLGVVAAR